MMKMLKVVGFETMEEDETSRLNLLPPSRLYCLPPQPPPFLGSPSFSLWPSTWAKWRTICDWAGTWPARTAGLPLERATGTGTINTGGCRGNQTSHFPVAYYWVQRPGGGGRGKQHSSYLPYLCNLCCFFFKQKKRRDKALGEAIGVLKDAGGVLPVYLILVGCGGQRKDAVSVTCKHTHTHKHIHYTHNLWSHMQIFSSKQSLMC